MTKKKITPLNTGKLKSRLTSFFCLYENMRESNTLPETAIMDSYTRYRDNKEFRGIVDALVKHVMKIILEEEVGGEEVVPHPGGETGSSA